MSQAYNFNQNFSERKIIGISALPGTGKTTLGKWLEAISLKLNFKVNVISIDDFYLPSDEMKYAINNNPWNVSRGFPGSHSVHLMRETLLNWKVDGHLKVPVFDKSLRNGLGDSPNDLPLLINSDFKIVIPGINGPNLTLLNKLKNYEITIAERPNGHGWKHELTKLIDILDLRR